MAEPVTLDEDDGVVTLTVNSPPANQLSDPVVVALTEAAARIAGDGSVRAAVVTGSGDRAFIAGADLREFRSILGERREMERHLALTRPMFDAWSELEVPVVAAVNAHALGGGLEFALACDFIVADPGARFGLPEVTLGLMPGAGGTQRLSRRIGLGPARELTMLGELVTAERAAELGLIDAVAEEGQVRREAENLARKLATRPALAVRAIKRALRHSSETGLKAGLDAERAQFLEVTMSADAREGAEAFLERREPRFEHR